MAPCSIKNKKRSVNNFFFPLSLCHVVTSVIMQLSFPGDRGKKRAINTTQWSSCSHTAHHAAYCGEMKRLSV